MIRKHAAKKRRRNMGGAGLLHRRAGAGICALALLMGAASIRSQAARFSASDPIRTTMETGSILWEPAGSPEDEETQILLPSAGISYALSVDKTSIRDIEDYLLQSGCIGERKQSPRKNVSISVINAWKGPEESGNSRVLEAVLTPVQQKEKDIITRAADTGMVSMDEAMRLTASAVTIVSSTTQAREDAMAALQAAEQAAQESVAWISEQGSSAQQALTTGEQTASSAEDLQARLSEGQQVTQGENADPQASQTGTGPARDLVVAQVNSYSYVNVRKEPSLDAEIVGKLYSNGVGTVVEGANEDGWIKIKSGNVTGFVKMDHVATGKHAEELADEVGHKQAVIKTTTLRVRASNSTESDVISLIGMGAELDIIEEADGWYKVRTDDGEGYISADFADVEVIYPVAESREEEARKAAEAAKAAEEAARKSASSASGSNAPAAKAAPAPTISKGQEVVNFAMQYLGNPYVWGGSSLTRGTDCSGFTMAVYAHFGVNLPHYDASQRSCGIAVSGLSQAQPGDLICYYGHVGIYIGDGKIVHASNPRTGITTQNANYRQIAAIRRIFY